MHHGNIDLYLSGVIVSIVTSVAIDRGFDLPSAQPSDFKIATVELRQLELEWFEYHGSLELFI